MEATKKSIDKWIKKQWDTYNMECYSAIEKNEILQVPYDFTHMRNLINQQNRNRLREQTNSCQREGQLWGWVKKVTGLRHTDW